MLTPPTPASAWSITITDRAPSPRRRRPSAASTSSSSIRSDTTPSRSSRPSTTSCAIPRSARAHVRRPVVAPGDRLLAQELDRRQRHFDAEGSDADHGRGPAGAQHVPGLADRRRRADHLERVVDSAARSARAPPAPHRRERSPPHGSRHGGPHARACPMRGRPPRSWPRRPAARRRSPAGRHRRSRSPHTVSPTRTPARLTAPIPVTTPHPSSAACHRGIDAGSGTAPAAGTTAYSAKQATMKPCWSSVPSRARRREVPSISIPATPLRPAGSHSVGRPDRHGPQMPHAGTRQNAT